jgi:hypothetical protein
MFAPGTFTHRTLFLETQNPKIFAFLTRSAAQEPQGQPPIAVLERIAEDSFAQVPKVSSVCRMLQQRKNKASRGRASIKHACTNACWLSGWEKS